jgi:hypothetical protein
MAVGANDLIVTNGKVAVKTAARIETAKRTLESTSSNATNAIQPASWSRRERGVALPQPDDFLLRSPIA